jgi:parallel beta-helix repeat protein
MKSKHSLLLVLLLGMTPSGALLAQACTERATKCITAPGGGDCSSIGRWDAASKTCTLSGDLAGESIQIAGDGITLDGDGHILKSASGNGLPQRVGVYAEERNGVTITNLTIREFQAGIQLLRCSGNKVTNNKMSGEGRVGIELLESNKNQILNNVLSAAGDGISVKQSADNILDGNLAESNRDSGIILNASSSGNTVTRNTARLNSGGIAVAGGSRNNTISENEVTGNTRLGIALYFSANDNVVTNNRIAGNAVGAGDGAGVLLMQASGNRLSQNTVANNSRGIWLAYPNSSSYPGGGNEVYNNNFIGNTTQALITGWRSTPDSFSKQAPIGGNYWGNWTTPDANGDGVVDSPYLISGGGDNLPWKVKDGWSVQPGGALPDKVAASPEQR